MLAAELFVKCLETEGVQYVFGLPGEENAHFMLALEDSPIRFILCRHEQGAAFMADVYGRLTGNAAVALATLGPGATNLVTGVADANMDRAPMLVITGQADSLRQHKESHQSMDVVSMFRPLTKWAHSILHPDNIPEVVRKAMRLARSEKPGAVHLELAENIAEMETKALPMSVRRFRRPVPDEVIVDAAFARLRAARRPIILAGNGCIRKRASAQLRLLCDKTGIGVVNTFMAKGCVDMQSPSCLFTIGLQARDIVACAVEAADLVIAIGYDMVEYHPRLWNTGEKKSVIHIDFLPAEIDSDYHPEVELVGDVAHALSMLNDRIDRAGGLTFDTSMRDAVRREMSADFAEHKDDDTDGFIRPQKAIWDLRRAMRSDDILLSDVGAHKMWVARYYQCREPNTCLISNGFCSMGFALPGAIAAKLVHPDKRVLAVCGDGGFLMNVQELETAKRLGTNIVIMVWVDGSYGLIEWKQETQFGRSTSLRFNNPDFVKLAESFGCVGMQINRSRDLAPALDRAFAADSPVIIAIPIDYRENTLLSRRLGALACPI